MIVLNNFSVHKWKILFSSLMVLHLRTLGSSRSVSIIKDWGKNHFACLHFFFIHIIQMTIFRSQVNVFLLLLPYLKKELKLSAVVEPGWCCEGTHDNILNRHGACWKKGSKTIVSTCVNLKGLWISWTSPWHVLEKCNTLRKSTVISWL